MKSSLNNHKSFLRCHKKYTVQSLGSMELNELETLWEENQENEILSKPENDNANTNDCSMSQHPVNMHLFYGSELDAFGQEISTESTRLSA